MSKWDWNAMQLRLQKLYVNLVFRFFVIFTFSAHRQTIVMLFYECDFIYWKASVFPITWARVNGRNKKGAKIQSAWTQMSRGLQKITIFIQLPLVRRFESQKWPHSTHTIRTHKGRVSNEMKELNFYYSVNIELWLINYIIHGIQHWIYKQFHLLLFTFLWKSLFRIAWLEYRCNRMCSCYEEIFE